MRRMGGVGDLGKAVEEGEDKRFREYLPSVGSPGCSVERQKRARNRDAEAKEKDGLVREPGFVGCVGYDKGKQAVSDAVVVSGGSGASSSKAPYFDSLHGLNIPGTRIPPRPDQEDDCEVDSETDTDDSSKLDTSLALDINALHSAEEEDAVRFDMNQSAIGAASDSVLLDNIQGMKSCSNFPDRAKVEASKRKENAESLMKPCTCKICCKAAFMWTDLNYQDTRSRLSALKKSRKSARLLAAKYYDCTTKATGDSSKQVAAALDQELMQQWCALFTHTENILLQEISQTNNELQRLKSLRERCRQELDTVPVPSTEK